MNVLIEPSPNTQKKLSTGKVDVTNAKCQESTSGTCGQRSGLSGWASLHPSRYGPRRAAVRRSHWLSFSISTFVSWTSVFLNPSVERMVGGEGFEVGCSTIRPYIHCQQPVNVVVLQPELPVCGQAQSLGTSGWGSDSWDCPSTIFSSLGLPGCDQFLRSSHF